MFHRKDTRLKRPKTPYFREKLVRYASSRDLKPPACRPGNPPENATFMTYDILRRENASQMDKKK